MDLQPVAGPLCTLWPLCTLSPSDSMFPNTLMHFNNMINQFALCCAKVISKFSSWSAHQKYTLCGHSGGLTGHRDPSFSFQIANVANHQEWALSSIFVLLKSPRKLDKISNHLEYTLDWPEEGENCNFLYLLSFLHSLFLYSLAMKYWFLWGFFWQLQKKN